MSSKTNNDPEGHPPLSPAVFHILLALADEERHGYGIMQEVKRRTDGKVRLGAGTLYGAIKRLLEKGIIAETDERPDREMNEDRRRYYRLTDFGQRVLRVEVSRLNQLVQQARAKEVLPAIASLLVMESV